MADEPVTTPGPAAPKPPESDSPKRGDGRFTLDDLVITSFAFLSFTGGVLLLVFRHPPPPAAVTALLLASGLSALVYRFLGGLGPGELKIGALKLAGTMATLMTVFLLLYKFLPPDPPEWADPSGEWRFQWSEGGWAGTVTFESTRQKGKYKVKSGKVDRVSLTCSKDDVWAATNSCGKSLFVIKGGDMTLDDQRRMSFAMTVRDNVLQRDVTWTTVGGNALVPGTCFGGKFVPVNSQGVPDSAGWGIFLEKQGK